MSLHVDHTAFSISPVASPLAAAALDALRTALSAPPTSEGSMVEERSIWQPDSWLIQRCWQTLADGGASAETMAVVRLAEGRNALAHTQAVYRLARQAAKQPGLGHRVAALLPGLEVSLLSSPTRAVTNTGNTNQTSLASSDLHQAEAFLYAAAAACLVDRHELALSFLERLDQVNKAWDRIFSNPEQRTLLAEVFVSIATHLAIHPLINALISSALRRFGDAGAWFLQEVASQASAKHSARTTRTRSEALLQRCVEVLRYGMLTTPQSQRIAIAVLGRAGQVEEVLQQLVTLANILEARHASGIDRQSDQNVIRQVKRVSAHHEIDFQVYALTEAIRAMPLRQVTREQRVALANKLALLGVRSDGWTAASAAATLVELGAFKFATDVIGKIHPRDPTRSEAVISLVRVLLAAGEDKLAAEQVQKGLAWARTITSHSRERALIRGLGEVYLQHHQPEMTIRLLDEWREPTGWRQRWRSLWAKQWDDDDLRNQALRLRALLHPDNRRPNAAPFSVETLVRDLRTWAPKLLEGEALVNFYAESLLRPLLTAGQIAWAWRILPEVQTVLALSVGDKHAARVAEIATLLADHMLFADRGAQPDQAGNQPDSQRQTEQQLAKFLINLWNNDARRGVWQTVHGIEGSLPLLMTLEGAEAIIAIAQAAPKVIGNEEALPVIDPGEGYGD